MSYSGVQPTFGTFPSDLFTANGSNTIFTMSSVPGNDAALLVTIDGVRQHTDTYSYSANTLTFSEAPPNGAVIETVNMGSRADVIITDGVYRKTQFTATAAQTNFNVSTGYTVGFVDVYLNGIRLVVADDFTANDGSTIILAVAAAAGDSVEVVAYGTFNVANALQKSGDMMSGNFVVSGTSTFNAPVAIANATGNTVVFANTGVVTFNANTTHVGAATFSNTIIAPSIITPVGIGLSAAYTAQNATAIYPTVNAGAAYPFLENSNLVLQRNSDRDFIVGGLNGSTLQQELVIKRGGYITMPYQPAFQARKYSGGNSAVANGNVVTYDEATTNRGNCFSTSTGRFTAPVAGSYFFYWTKIGNSVVTTHRTYIRKNGSGQWGYGYKFENRAYTNNSYPYGSYQVIVTLAVNDYVDIFYDADTAAYLYADVTDGPAFGGYLIG